ncbi:MAG TPA: glyoxalase/bleomycin resistance/extradiol dioxygenase family protein [Cyclobacteriaceae bacterium]
MKQIFINLPVADVEKSMNLYTQLGFTNNPEFTDDHQKCMVWCEQVYVMLHTRKTIPYSNGKHVASYTLPVESLDKVNEIIASGLKAGGTEPIPMIDEGFMQIRRIEDFDGHIWDIIFLDMVTFRKTVQKRINRKSGVQ